MPSPAGSPTCITGCDGDAIWSPKQRHRPVLERRVVMREAVVVEAVRTPIGKRNGGLAGVHPVDLSADVLNELLTRTGVQPDVVDDVIWGCVSQVGDQSSNVARFAVLAAGWPDHIPGVTVNRACGSSQQALDFA